MLYLDGISIQKIREELTDLLKNKKINRIFQKNAQALSLHFGKQELILSCVHNLSVCYITDIKEKPIVDISSSFIATLRKNLMNAMLVNIEQLGFDRILVFHFSRINELGELKHFKIYFEMFARNSNIIFTDKEDKIIECFKRDALSETKDRLLFVGAKYERAFYVEKINPLDLDEETFYSLQKEDKLIEKVEGLGRQTATFTKTFQDFQNLLKTKAAKIFFKNKNIKFASCLPLNIENKIDYDEEKNFSSFNELINFYISYSEVSTSFMLLKNRLLTEVNKKNKKLETTLSSIEADIEEEKNIDEIRQRGDIVAAAVHLIKKGMSSIKTYDFYNDAEIEISLNPLWTPKENLDKIYRLYNKVKRKIENAYRRREEIQNERKYLESIENFIEKSENLENLREIEEELIKLGYIKASYKTKKTKHKKENNYGSKKLETCTLYYGRNNLENDFLSFKFANKNDLWFHAKNIAGSHVILRAEEVTEENIFLAATLAAELSKSGSGEKVRVDYCLKKNLNKPKGAKPGFVTYVGEKSIVMNK